MPPPLPLPRPTTQGWHVAERDNSPAAAMFVFFNTQTLAKNVGGNESNPFELISEHSNVTKTARGRQKQQDGRFYSR